MAQTDKQNPLASLNLGGLAKLEEQTKEKGLERAADGAVLESLSVESLRAEKPVAAAAGENPTPVPPPVPAPDVDALTLGPLAGFPGTWVGNGFNLIEVPNRNQDPKAQPKPVDKFKLILNNMSETLTITEIKGGIINRGNAQGDIEYLSLHYLQQVDDVNVLPGQTGRGIHVETGLFLNLPAGTDPKVQPAVARLGSIPHGDSLLAQGAFVTLKGVRPDFSIGRADPTPFTIKNGKRSNVTNADYLSLLKNAVAPAGIPQAAVLDPTILLEEAIKDLEVLDMTVIFLDANPIKGLSNQNAISHAGGINNIPFVTKNANAVTFTSIFWLMTVKKPDNTTTKLLQYTQTIVLDFPISPSQSGPTLDVKWPHVVVATLELQP